MCLACVRYCFCCALSGATQIYDLKGSLRNRFAQADPQEESPVPTVLMDENLLTSTTRMQ